ncbi:MAG: phosphotransferase [Gammaproteobacteria bacterium]
MTPAAALASIGSLVAGARVVEALPGGPASDSYLVGRGAERWVLRIDNPVAQQLGLDRAAESVALGYADERGVGPRLAYIDVERGVQLTGYVDGRCWTPADLADRQQLTRLAELLRRVHGIGRQGRPLALRERVFEYAAGIATPAARRTAADVAALLDELGIPQQCLCHNDLVTANIIDGDELRLIDWEYAAVGDPFFDLAIVAEHHALPDDLASCLLLAYAPDAGDAQVLRLAGYRQVYARVLELWQDFIACVSRTTTG